MFDSLGDKLLGSKPSLRLLSFGNPLPVDPIHMSFPESRVRLATGLHGPPGGNAKNSVTALGIKPCCLLLSS